MKKASILFLTAIAILAVVSCNKEKTEKDNGPVSVSITGVLGEFQPVWSKGVLVNTIRPEWEEGDIVYMFAENSATFLGTLAVYPDGDNASRAKLTGEIKNPVEGNLCLVYGSVSPTSSLEEGMIFSSTSFGLSVQESGLPFVALAEISCPQKGSGDVSAEFSIATAVVGLYLSGLPASETVSSVSISNIENQCNISTADMAVGGSKYNNGIISVNNPAKTNAQGQAYFEFAVPFSGKATHTVTVNVGSSVYSGSFIGEEYRAGKAYHALAEISL